MGLSKSEKRKMLKDWKRHKNNEAESSANTTYLKSKSVLIFDMMYLFKSHLVANRAMSENGVPVGGVKGPLDKIYWFTKKHNAKTVVCVFDGKDSHVKRQEIYEDYKSHRKKANKRLSSPHNLNAKDQKHNKQYQMNLLVKVLNLLPVKMIIHKRLEADDIIGYLTKKFYGDKGGQRVIVSNDKDFYQLIDKNTAIHDPRKKKIITSDNLTKFWDTYPKNIIYYRCIEGDSSDNVQGIKGVSTGTIEKYFPELQEREIESLDEFIELIKSKEDRLKETSRGKSILNGIDTIRRNYKICQLIDVDLSADEKNKILNSMNRNEYNYKSKYQLQKLVKQQKVSKILQFRRLEEFYNLIRIS